MRIWRICGAALPGLDGEGARLYGGRWNHKGTPLVYAGGSYALAILERWVNTDPDLDGAALAAYPVDVPDSLRNTVVRVAKLPADWTDPKHRDTLRNIGAEWVRRSRTAVLSVPSAVVPVERNYVLNPRHPAFRRIRIGKPQPFSFDPRMKK